MYIARGSLTEAQYLTHLAGRLSFLSAAQLEQLEQWSRRTYGCLYGLIKAVEREAGVLGKLVATATSLVALCLAR